MLLLSGLLLHLYRIIGQISEGSIAIHGATVWLSGPIRCSAHKSTHLVLQCVILLLQLIVLLFDPKMMLYFLCLVVMAHLHLMRPRFLQFFLEALLLVSKGLERQYDLLNLVLTLLEHFLLLTILTVEALSLASPLLLVPPRVFYLPIFDLDQLTQILILLLQRLVLGHYSLFLLFGLCDASLILLLLLAELSDLALQISH